MIKRIILSIAILSSVVNFATAQRLVKLNMLEKSPLSNMVVYSTNDSTARYTKLLAGTGIQITYNENDTTLTITATGTSVGVPQTLSLDDGTRVLSISDGNSVDLSESIQEEINAMLVAGDNVTLTYNDVANTLTIASTGGGGGATNIGDLGDVTITSATTGQVLKYDGAAWINATLTDLNTDKLADLTDVDTTGQGDNYALRYDAGSGNYEMKVNDIDGLDDGYTQGTNNLFVGREPATGYAAPNNTIITKNGVDSLIYPDGYSTGMIAIGTNVYDRAKTGSANSVIIGNGASALSTGHDEVIAIGGRAGERYNGAASIFIGQKAGQYLTGSAVSSRWNTLIGHEAAISMTTGTENVGLGFMVNMVNGDNQIVIGSGTNTGVYVRNTSKGPNSAKLGNERIDSTFLYGNLHFPGYGLGDKEAADLSKTGSGYFLEVATDGTLIESTVTGGTAQTLSFDDATRELSISSGNTVDLTEGIQDEIAATVIAGTGITVTYDDALGTFEIAAPAGSGNTDEQTLSINNATAELSISNGNTVDLSEAIDAQVNTLFVDGTNIQSTYDDGANTLTVRTTDALTQIDAITFDNNATDAVAGRLQYDNEFGTLVFGLANNTPLHIGTDMGWYVKNQTGSNIAAGVPVYASGTDGASGRINIAPMIADGSINAKYFLGVTAEAINNGADGFIWTHGKIRDIDLSGFSAGDVLYVSSASAGAFVNTSPAAPNLKLPVGFVVNNAANGTLAVRSTVGTYLSENHDVQITSAAIGEVLKFDGSKWVDGTDLVDDADADPTNEIQTITASNGLTATATGDDYDLKLGGTLSDVTTSINMDDNALTFTNNGGFALSGDGGVSFTNTSLTDYSSVLSLAATNTRIYADGGTTEPLNSINLTTSRSGVKEMDIRSSVSNDNGVYTMIALNPTRLSIKTPNVTDVTAQNGQYLKLVDRLTGEVEFDDIIDLTSLSVTTNAAGTAALSYNNTNGVFTYTPPDLSSYLTAEVDGSTTNEIQTISLAGNDLTLSDGGGTVTLPSYTSESTTASNGLTLSGSDVKLGGTLTETTTINLGGTYSFNISESGSNTLFKVFNDLIEARGVLYQHDGVVRFGDYGLGSIDPSPTQTASDYLLGLTTDGTLIEVDKTAFTQDLSLTGNTLSLSGDATTVDLSGYLDNTDAQAISLTSNTLSITGNASTVDLSGYLDDQTVSLTGAGITAISGTYPNFTITSTEVDGSVTNEGQLSASTVISGTTARLTSNTGGGSNVDYVAGTGLAVSSSGGNTITYTNTLPEATTASNGLTETGTDVRLGGVLTQDVLIGLSTFDFIVGQDDVSMQMYPGDGTVFDGLLRFLDYGSGNKEAADLSKTKSNYKAAFATDGTLIEVDDIDAMVIACSDETTDITTGTAKVTFRAPHAMTITGVRASLTTASILGTPTVDINESGTSILGTKLTIDATEKTSTTAATAATITDTVIADDAEITIDVDAAGTGATGLKVTILYRKN